MLPVAVTVVIAAEPEQINLADVEAVEDSCYTDTDSMNGKQFAELLTCETDRFRVNQTWIVKRAADTLTGRLGIPDTLGSGSNQSVQVEIIADGTVLETLTASYGLPTVPIDVDITGALRLTFRVRSLTRDYSTAGLAKLRVSGDAKKLSTLEVYE